MRPRPHPPERTLGTALVSSFSQVLQGQNDAWPNVLSRGQAMPESTIPAYITSLIRHFEDLRDGTHGGSATRKDKEAHFEKAVQLLAPIARQVLIEINRSLLLNTGQLTETGLRRIADGGLNE